MLNLLLFLTLNSILFTGAALVARYGLKLTDRLAIVLATALVGWVSIVVGLEVLALFGQLRLVPATVLAFGSFGAGALVRMIWRPANDLVQPLEMSPLTLAPLPSRRGEWGWGEGWRAFGSSARNSLVQW